MLDAIPNLVHGLDQTKSIERCTLLRCQKRLIKTYEDAKTKYFTHSAAVTSPEVVETAAETATEIIKAVGLETFKRALRECGKRKRQDSNSSSQNEACDQLDLLDNEAATNLLRLKFDARRQTQRPRTPAHTAPVPAPSKSATPSPPGTPDLHKVLY